MSAINMDMVLKVANDLESHPGLIGAEPGPMATGEAVGQQVALPSTIEASGPADEQITAIHLALTEQAGIRMTGSSVNFQSDPDTYRYQVAESGMTDGALAAMLQGIGERFQTMTPEAREAVLQRANAIYEWEASKVSPDGATDPGGKLSGYAGFSFGEGLKDKPFHHVGGLYDGGNVRVDWDDWQADSLGFTAAFSLNAVGRGQSLEAGMESRKQALEEYFRSQGITIEGVNVRTGTGEIEIKMSIEDVSKARIAIYGLDSAGLDTAGAEPELQQAPPRSDRQPDEAAIGEIEAGTLGVRDHSAVPDGNPALRGYAVLAGEESVVAVFSSGEFPRQTSFFLREQDIGDLLEKELPPEVRATYNGALEGMHGLLASDECASLQRIGEVNNFVLPDGRRLGDTPDGNQPGDRLSDLLNEILWAPAIPSDPPGITTGGVNGGPANLPKP